MNLRLETHSSRDEVQVAAAAWVLRYDRGLTAAEKTDLEQWLSEEPAHGAAFAGLRKNWGRLDALTALRIEGDLDPDLLAPPSFGWRKIIPFVTAMAALFMLGLFFYPRWIKSGAVPVTVNAMTVEVRTLDDGSVLHLNSGTRTVILYTAHERRVELVQGEAYFEVTKDAQRPFLVRVAGADVVAVGTAFNVKRDGGNTEVTVTEGKVRITVPELASLKAAGIPLLAAGDRAVISSNGETSITHLQAAELEAGSAWRISLLNFNATTLAAVTAEFNRHNTIQMIVADHELDELRLSGSFRATNMRGLVRLLETDYGIAAEETGKTILLKKISSDHPSNLVAPRP